MASLIVKALDALEAGNEKLAQKLCRRCLRENPADFDAQHLTGIIALGTNQPAHAVRELKKAIAIRPDYPMVHNNLGAAYKANNDHRKAVDAFTKAITLAPDNPELCFNAAKAYEQCGFWHDAATNYQKASAEFPLARLGSGRISRITGDFLVAESRLKTLIDGELRIPAIKELCLVYEMTAGVDAVLTFLQECVDRKPSCVTTRYLLAEACIQSGRSDMAINTLVDILSIDPNHRSTIWRLAALGYFDSASKLKDLLASHWPEPGSSNEMKADWHHTIFLAFEHLGDIDNAGKHLLKANKLRYVRGRTSMKREQIRFDNICKTFEMARDVDFEVSASEELVPVFVVGMPRSGTSLVEQILASHSMVSGAGELTYLPELIRSEGEKSLYLQNSQRMSRSDMIEIRTAYLVALKANSRGRKYVIDKYPHNFLNLGLIACLFPEAKIVLCEREPLDTCFSCYKQFFTGELAFSYDQHELVRYFLLYQTLTNYWKKALGDRVKIVAYEQLTQRFDREVQTLLSSIGLGWEDQVEKFATNQRMVKTQSALQVRNQINQDAIAAWEPYKKFLGPMIEEFQKSS